MVMRNLWLLMPALFLLGCMTPQSTQQMVDENIATNFTAVVEPALAALAADLKETRQLSEESQRAVSDHQSLLLEVFRAQRAAAEAAIRQLAPIE